MLEGSVPWPLGIGRVDILAELELGLHGLA